MIQNNVTIPKRLNSTRMCRYCEDDSLVHLGDTITVMSPYDNIERSGILIGVCYSIDGSLNVIGLQFSSTLVEYTWFDGKFYKFL